MSLPVMKPDRRRPTRVKPIGLAYINIEPDNGGIVLNVSEGGLCFHSVAPVRRDGKVLRFWFSAEGNRVEAQGRLAWLDEKGKTGGLQFKSLSSKAHERVRSWMSESAEPLGSERKPGPIRELPRRVTAKGNPMAAAVAAVRRATQRLPFERVQRVKDAVRWNEYSRGLATGLLIGLAIAGVALFRSHRQQLGEALIRMGEHFAPRSQQASTVSASAVTASQQSVAVDSRMAKPAPAAPNSGTGASPAAKPNSPKTNVVPEPIEKMGPAKPVPKQEKVGPESPPPAPNDVLPTRVDTASLPVLSEMGTLARPDFAEQPIRETRTAVLKPASPPTDESEDIAEANSGLPFGKYLEVGKFKDQWRANELIDALNRLGIEATAVPQNLLWLTSYQVLAGPYGNDDQTRLARRNLESEGFTTHSLPKRSRQVTFWAPTKGIRKPEALVGSFVVTWQPYSADVTVKFVKENGRVVTGQGKWERRVAKYSNDGIEYQTNDDGSRSLVQIWFRGMKQAVVLPNASSHQGVNF